MRELVELVDEHAGRGEVLLGHAERRQELREHGPRGDLDAHVGRGESDGPNPTKTFVCTPRKREQTIRDWTTQIRAIYPPDCWVHDIVELENWCKMDIC